MKGASAANISMNMKHAKHVGESCETVEPHS